jgi:hypothetical protein
MYLELTTNKSSLSTELPRPDNTLQRLSQARILAAAKLRLSSPGIIWLGLFIVVSTVLTPFSVQNLLAMGRLSLMRVI